MSGYAASARIIRASPRVVTRDGAVRWPEPPVPVVAAAVIDDRATASTALPGVSIAERWSRFRDRWTQLTFYVTDPQSWR